MLDLGDERRDDILNWAKDAGVSMFGGTLWVDLRSFDPIRTWYFETEKDKLLFLLKWGNNERSFKSI